MKVLVINSAELDLSSVVSSIINADYTPTVISSFEEAFKILSKELFDIFILTVRDEAIPSEFLHSWQEFSELAPQVPKIIVSLHDLPYLREQASSLDSVAFLHLGKDDLSVVSTIQSVLEPYIILRQSRILVVDDSASVRAILQKTLTSQGATVILAKDGEEGYQIICQDWTAIDLVILDQNMPKLNGNVVCERVRKTLGIRYLPIVFLTGTDNREEISSIFKAGASDYLIKPFIEQELLTRVQSGLENYFLFRDRQKMIGCLNQKNAELEEQKTLLEQRVLERTIDLERINQQLNQELEKGHVRERILQENIQIAEDAARSKSEFLANMSHEIRTPLNGIIGMTNLALDLDLSAEARDLLSTVASSGTSLLTIINDILDFSKIEAGKLEISEEVFELHPLVNRINQILALKAAEKDIQLLFNFDPSIPKNLHGDEVRLGQILLNLVGNALKFTPNSGAVIVYVTLSKLVDEVCEITFSIADSGIGIAHDKLDHVFNAFSQADASTTRKYGGTGLGLSISKKLVELMRGRLWVDSVEGRGSNFQFSLSFRRVDPLAESKSSASTSLMVAHDGIRQVPLNILLAEDNQVNQKLARLLLQKRGHHVTVVENGEEAVNFYCNSEAAAKVDLILMDCQMPVMSGYEATAKIREWESSANRHVPIVALTANALSGDREKCLNWGMDAYLSKPIVTKDLEQTLLSILARQ